MQNEAAVRIFNVMHGIKGEANFKKHDNLKSK